MDAVRVVAVSRSDAYTFSKAEAASIRLIAGFGVEGDVHAGATIRHRGRIARDPTAPNLRQVHLIHAELHDRLARDGMTVDPGQMGENVTTRGIDLLGLPTGARLRLGADAVVEITGLRNPCRQLDGLRRGLMAAMLEHDPEGGTKRLAGIMAVVVTTGVVRPGDPIAVSPPDGSRRPLEPV
jgi:MOSC domain-containing protein YiiM